MSSALVIVCMIHTTQGLNANLTVHMKQDWHAAGCRMPPSTCTRSPCRYKHRHRRINQKTASIACEDGLEWRVSFGLLQRVIPVN